MTALRLSAELKAGAGCSGKFSEVTNGATEIRITVFVKYVIGVKCRTAQILKAGIRAGGKHLTMAMSGGTMCQLSRNNFGQNSKALIWLS